MLKKKFKKKVSFDFSMQFSFEVRFTMGNYIRISFFENRNNEQS